tara:strand:+ start:281 stop:736 length:456 start_codon:yes stop_codon:yes gene_type:complete
MKKIFILFIFIITSCGYQPLYKVDNKIVDLKLKDVKFVGNEKISKKIFTKLPFALVKNDELLNTAIIDSSISTIEASKNSKGQVTSYRTYLTVKFKILNNMNKTIDEKFYQKEFVYNTNENKFKLREYQNKIEENLINNIIEDLIIYLNYS